MNLPEVPRASLNILPIDWSGLNKRYINPGELEVIVALVRSVLPEDVLEIGVNAGRTAKAILDNVPSITKYQGVDVLPGYRTSRTVQRSEIPPNPGAMVRGDPRFHLILRSYGSFDLTPTDLGPCDVVFIDGDHGAAAVRWDTEEIAYKVVRPGGMVIWHDYNGRSTVDVTAVLDEYYQAGARDLRHVQGTWVAFRPM
jgi:predicted O-methyltransferase YrrM